MPPMNPNFNPASIMVQNGPKANPPISPVKGTAQVPYTTGQQQSQTIGAQSVRATGKGPFDAAYRQNLATYAGGLFNRPGGNLSFNPTGNLSDLGGQALGGGNAPVYGGPQSLLAMALGGTPASVGQPTTGNKTTTPAPSGWQQWLNQFGRYRGLGPERYFGA